MVSYIHSQSRKIIINQQRIKFRNYLLQIFPDSPKIDFQKAKTNFEVFVKYDDF
jgi:hypothetical protein